MYALNMNISLYMKKCSHVSVKRSIFLYTFLFVKFN